MKAQRTWLRYDDVECVRCERIAGAEYEACYVVDEGVVCVECTTEAEKEEAR